MANRIPVRGDIVSFTAEAGLGGRSQCVALVLSPGNFNKTMQLALVAPIVGQASGNGFEVRLEKTRTLGVALCHQLRTIDVDQRTLKFIEVAPERIVNVAVRKASLVLC